MADPSRFVLSDDDYYYLEDEISTTARGRAFLRMRDQRSRVVALDEVRRFMASVHDWASTKAHDASSGAQIQVLRRELQEMSAYIQKTREEIASLRTTDTTAGTGNSRIHAASGELDAIVVSTERASTEILNAAEQIMKLADSLPEECRSVGGDITMQATEIMTACAFQDLTGQRVTKVVKTLQYLEHRVAAMVSIWGIDEQDKPAVHDADADTRPDAHLLNGPAALGQAKTQDEIDSILNGTTAPAAAPVPAPAPAPASTPAPAPAAPKPAPVAAKPPSKPAAPAPATAATPKIDQSEIDKLFA